MKWIEEGRNLLITGLTGAEKSYFANVLGILAIKQFKTVKYFKCDLLLKEFDVLKITNEPEKHCSILKNSAQ